MLGKRKDKQGSVKEGWSKWFLRAVFLAVFFYIIKWSFTSFYANNCGTSPHFEQK